MVTSLRDLEEQPRSEKEEVKLEMKCDDYERYYQLLREKRSRKARKERE